MDRIDMLLRAVGRIEGKLEEIPDLSHRVSSLEMWQWCLKGAWGAVLGMYVYAWRALGGR